MIPKLITSLIHSGLQGAWSWSLRNHSIAPKREGGFPCLFQGREEEKPGSHCPLGLCVSPTLPAGNPSIRLGLWDNQGAGQSVGTWLGEEARGEGEAPIWYFKNLAHAHSQAGNWVWVLGYHNHCDRFLKVFSCQALHPTSLQPHSINICILQKKLRL